MFGISGRSADGFKILNDPIPTSKKYKYHKFRQFLITEETGTELRYRYNLMHLLN